MKKGLLLGLAAVMSFSLVACGGNKGNDNKTTEPSTSVSAEATESGETTGSMAPSESADATESAEASGEVQGEETATYVLVNKTGEKIVELYHFENGQDKGENLAGEGLADGEQVVSTVNYDAAKTKEYESTLQFKTESGYEGIFDKLHFENVTIDLLSEDAKTGPTPISFVKE
jgi:hypothetical protein